MATRTITIDARHIDSSHNWDGKTMQAKRLSEFMVSPSGERIYLGPAIRVQFNGNVATLNPPVPDNPEEAWNYQFGFPDGQKITVPLSQGDDMNVVDLVAAGGAVADPSILPLGTANIGDKAVTLPKLADLAGQGLIGRGEEGVGEPVLLSKAELFQYFTDNRYALADGGYSLIGFTVRPNYNSGTAQNVWDYIQGDGVHETLAQLVNGGSYLGTPSADANGLTLPFSPNFSKVIAMAVTVDDTLSKFGYSVGPSIGATGVFIPISNVCGIRGQLSRVVNGGVSEWGVVSSSMNGLSVTYDPATGLTVVTHPPVNSIDNAVILTPQGTTRVTDIYRPQRTTRTTTTLSFLRYDSAGALQINALPSGIAVDIERPGSYVSNALTNNYGNNSNIWVFGIMKR